MRPARRGAELATSSAGRPNSFTSVAPGAENRSVIWVVIAALWSAASRSRSASREPIRRAGITNIGSRTSASRVTCHESRSITASASASAITLPTTLDSVHVNARCAPITSLFRRLDECAGAGPREERDRHALHVAEHRAAQIQDQALADPRRLPPLGDPDHGVDERDDCDRDLQPDHPRRALAAP